MNPQNYTINIRPGWGISQVVKVSQGDVGRPLAFTIMDGQDAITLSSTATVTITGTKPSGLGFTQACTLSGNTASIDTVATMTQETGSVPAELIVTDGSTVIGTANFVMYVEPAAHPEGTTDGDAETARDLMTRAEAAVAQAEAEADRAEDAAESASQTGISTVGATAGQVPTANGAGGWSWQDPQGGIGGTSDDIENASSVSGSTVSDALNSLSGEITSEATARTSAVSEVQSAVAEEVSTRANADESLRQAIDNLVSPEGQSVVVDSSLSISGAAADAKKTGDVVAELKNDLDAFDSIFDNPNVMDYNDSVLTTGLSVNITTGAVTAGSVNVKDIIIPVEPEKTYTLLLPAMNRGGMVAHSSKEFVAGTTYQKVNANTAYSNIAIFTVPTGCSYILFHFYTGADFAGALEDFKLYEGQYAETEKNITLNDDAIPLASVTSRKQGLSPIAYLFEDIYKLQDQNLTWNTGVSILLDGSVGNAGISTDNVSDNVDVSAHDMVYIKASAGHTRLLYAFYDSNGTFILGKNSISTGYEDFAEYVKVPITAKYLKVAQSTGAGSSAGALSFVIGIYDKPWKNKKWVCIGDSLTQVNSTSTKRYYEYVQDVTGIQVENFGVGGTGYANPNGTAGNFVDRMANIPTDADVYTIFGSFNDVDYGRTNNIEIGTASDSGTTTMCGYFNAAIDALLTRVPLANVGVVAPCPWQYCYPAGTGENSTYGKAYVDALEEVCKRRSIPFLNLFNFSGMRPWDSDFRTIVYTDDPAGGVHPNAIGHEILSPKFKQFLEYLLI